MKLHVGWGGEDMHLVNHVNGASERCEVRRAFDKAPHVRVAGTPAVSTSCSWATSSLYMRWMRSQDIPSFSPPARRTYKKFRMPSVADGWESVGRLRIFEWLNVGDGRTKNGRTLDQSGVSSSDFKDWELTIGFLNVVMVLGADFIIAQRLATVSEARRFSRELNGVGTLPCLLAVILRARWPRGPIQWIFSYEMTEMSICYLHRIPLFPDASNGRGRSV